MCDYFMYIMALLLNCLFFFFNDTATTEIYTLSLHDALPICRGSFCAASGCAPRSGSARRRAACGIRGGRGAARSEEHTSELQSLAYLVCRLLLEKKKTLASAPQSRRRWARSTRVGCRGSAVT